MTRLWEVYSDEDKQGMARHLFEYLVYDLEKQEIVDFRLKSWAENFLTLRAALYAEEKNYGPDYNDNRIVPTGLDITRLPLPQIIDWLLTASHLKSSMTHIKQTRDELIRIRHEAVKSSLI